MGQLVLSFLAGMLTSISPCILPILPLILGSALQVNKWAPIFVAMGLIFSFTIIGTAIVYLSSCFGFDPGPLRYLGGFLLLLIGSSLLFKSVQVLLQRILTPISNLANQYSIKYSFDSLLGQFILGVLLGFVWSPCVGPTIGVAIGLATQSATFADSLLLMLLFSLGANIPLVIIAYGSRKLFLEKRNKLIDIGQKSKIIMGLILVLIAINIILGFDKKIEAVLLNQLPGTWIELLNKL